MEQVKKTKIEGFGETFYINMDSEYFAHNDIVYFTNNTDPPMKARVKKVYKFNWWRKLLFKLGVSIKSMEIEKAEPIIPSAEEQGIDKLIEIPKGLSDSDFTEYRLRK